MAGELFAKAWFLEQPSLLDLWARCRSWVGLRRDAGMSRFVPEFMRQPSRGVHQMSSASSSGILGWDAEEAKAARLKADEAENLEAEAALLKAKAEAGPTSPAGKLAPLAPLAPLQMAGTKLAPVKLAPVRAPPSAGLPGLTAEVRPGPVALAPPPCQPPPSHRHRLPGRWRCFRVARFVLYGKSLMYDDKIM